MITRRQNEVASSPPTSSTKPNQIQILTKTLLTIFLLGTVTFTNANDADEFLTEKCPGRRTKNQREEIRSCARWSLGMEHESMYVHRVPHALEEYVVNVGKVAREMRNYGRVHGLDRQEHSIAVDLIADKKVELSGRVCSGVNEINFRSMAESVSTDHSETTFDVAFCHVSTLDSMVVDILNASPSVRALSKTVGPVKPPRAGMSSEIGIYTRTGGVTHMCASCGTCDLKDYTGSYHISISLPTNPADGRILKDPMALEDRDTCASDVEKGSDRRSLKDMLSHLSLDSFQSARDQWIAAHMNFANQIQWIEPLLLATMGSSDADSVCDDGRYVEGSYRVGSIGWGVPGTTDVRTFTKYATGRLSSNSTAGWLMELQTAYRDDLEGCAAKGMGSDIRVRSSVDEHLLADGELLPPMQLGEGIEIRAFDNFPIEHMPQVYRLISLLAESSRVHTSPEYIYNNDNWKKAMQTAMMEGWNGLLPVEYIKDLEDALNIDLSALGHTTQAHAVFGSVYEHLWEAHHNGMWVELLLDDMPEEMPPLKNHNRDSWELGAINAGFTPAEIYRLLGLEASDVPSRINVADIQAAGVGGCGEDIEDLIYLADTYGIVTDLHFSPDGSIESFSRASDVLDESIRSVTGPACMVEEYQSKTNTQVHRQSHVQVFNAESVDRRAKKGKKGYYNPPPVPVPVPVPPAPSPDTASDCGEPVTQTYYYGKGKGGKGGKKTRALKKSSKAYKHGAPVAPQADEDCEETEPDVPPTHAPPSATPPTAGPPTDTDSPPTAGPPTDGPPTSGPPTGTQAPPTAGPPTDVPPTAGPPTDVPPTDGPPTDVPPTDGPPTDVPPTAGPPNAGPPNAGPPTGLDTPPSAKPPTNAPVLGTPTSPTAPTSPVTPPTGGGGAKQCKTSEGKDLDPINDIGTAPGQPHVKSNAKEETYTQTQTVAQKTKNRTLKKGYYNTPQTTPQTASDDCGENTNTYYGKGKGGKGGKKTRALKKSSKASKYGTAAAAAEGDCNEQTTSAPVTSAPVTAAPVETTPDNEAPVASPVTSPDTLAPTLEKCLCDGDVPGFPTGHYPPATGGDTTPVPPTAAPPTAAPPTPIPYTYGKKGKGGKKRALEAINMSGSDDDSRMLKKSAKSYPQAQTAADCGEGGAVGSKKGKGKGGKRRQLKKGYKTDKASKYGPQAEGDCEEDKAPTLSPVTSSPVPGSPDTRKCICDKKPTMAPPIALPPITPTAPHTPAPVTPTPDTPMPVSSAPTNPPKPTDGPPTAPDSAAPVSSAPTNPPKPTDGPPTTPDSPAPTNPPKPTDGPPTTPDSPAPTNPPKPTDGPPTEAPPTTLDVTDAPTFPPTTPQPTEVDTDDDDGDCIFPTLAPTTTPRSKPPTPVTGPPPTNMPTVSPTTSADPPSKLPPSPPGTPAPSLSPIKLTHGPPTPTRPPTEAPTNTLSEAPSDLPSETPSSAPFVFTPGPPTPTRPPTDAPTTSPTESLAPSLSPTVTRPPGPTPRPPTTILTTAMPSMMPSVSLVPSGGGGGGPGDDDNGGGGPGDDDGFTDDEVVDDDEGGK